jgi:hypothetical protein
MSSFRLGPNPLSASRFKTVRIELFFWSAGSRRVSLFYLSLTKLAQAELVLSAVKPSSDQTPVAAFAFFINRLQIRCQHRGSVHNSHRVRESRHRNATTVTAFFYARSATEVLMALSFAVLPAALSSKLCFLARSRFLCAS